MRSSYNGEQLAYIGALATGAPLVFGDRPKDITYRWVMAGMDGRGCRQCHVESGWITGGRRLLSAMWDSVSGTAIEVIGT